MSALDLPLPPPTAADFPELPRAPPAPKMTKAEKTMAEKINTLLLSDVKGKSAPKPTGKNSTPAKAAAVVPTLATPPSKPAAVPGILPVPGNMRSDPLEPPPSPQPSGVNTPIMAMATLHAEHVISCSHDTGSCGICRVGITCCKCCLMYTAPAAKRMRCTKCLHWACDLDQSIGCCECGTPWIPLAVISSFETRADTKRAAQFRGGAGSETASESASTNASQDDSTVKIKISAPTQESLDEIDALSRPPVTSTGERKGKPERRRRPKSGKAPVNLPGLRRPPLTAFQPLKQSCSNLTTKSLLSHTSTPGRACRLM